MRQLHETTSGHTPFELSKWYLDCVGENGDALIVYFAELRWRGLAVRYASTLACRDGRVRSTSTLRGCAPPSVSGDTVAWRSRALRASGEWKALAEPLRETVLAREDGAIDWECLQPKSDAAVRADDGPGWSGLGYVERLRVTLAPWRMPVDELRWGRFLSQTDAVVWIDWRGAWSRRLAFHNGAAVAAERISDDEVVLAGPARLALEERRVLRRGALGSTVLAEIPGLARLAPARLLAVEETKWLSRASLLRPGAPAVRGWAVHEVVRWPH